MELGPAAAAFAVVFVAELGDRTQLLLLALATRHRVAPVVGGLVLGYGVTTALAVTVGATLGSVLPAAAVQVGSGLAFLGFALWTLLGSDHDDGGDEVTDTPGRHPLLLTASLAGAIILSEMGDKSQLATATLAADRAPVPVAVGALLGIIASGGIGVLAGRLLADRIDPRFLRWASAALFAVVGTVLLLGAL